MNILIILFGAPGCGKGHLSDRLIEALKQHLSPEEIAYISTGDLIRSEIAEATPTGLQIKELVQSGQLVPDEIVDKLVANAINGSQTAKILDGYPRTANQLAFLSKQIEEDVTVLTVFRDTPTETIKERIEKRRVCKNCKKTHSVDDGCCPYCGGESTIRKDDAVIDARLEEYKKNTLPLWYEIDLLGNTLRVDGLMESEEIAEAIVKLFF